MCDCGATDCPSCGPAQGYTVRLEWRGRRWVYVNPQDEPTDEPEEAPEEDDGILPERRAMAREILNLARDGQTVPLDVVNSALVETGDVPDVGQDRASLGLYLFTRKKNDATIGGPETK